ncbi:MAG: helix-turn-helix domain-containing protein [Pseudomonadota bacterium]
MVSHRSEDRNTVTFQVPAMAPFQAPPPRHTAPREPLREERPTSAGVERLIGRGTADQPSVAALLGMSVATLRRRLSDEGTSFRALRTRVLSARAMDMLGSDTSMITIAAELGFADIRSFSRAFKSWTGETPNAVRRQLKGS